MAAKLMTKSELVQKIAEKHGEAITRKDVKGVIESLAEIGYRELKKTGAFVVPGFAKFVVIKKPAVKARKGINPFTKEPTVFKARPARKIIKARPVKATKDAVAVRRIEGLPVVGECADARGVEGHRIQVGVGAHVPQVLGHSKRQTPPLLLGPENEALARIGDLDRTTEQLPCRKPARSYRLGLRAQQPAQDQPNSILKPVDLMHE